MQRQSRLVSLLLVVTASNWSQSRPRASNSPESAAVPPMFTAAAVVNAASYSTGSVAPGEMVSIFGDGLGPATAAGLQLTPGGLVSSTLGGTQVLFDNIPAPLIFVQQKQISAIVPYEIAGKTSTQVAVTTSAGASSPVTLMVSNTVPGLFTADSSGKGPAAALNQDGVTLNSPHHPAPAGSIVVLFGTGEGPTLPQGVDGRIATAQPLPSPALPVSVTIGGLPANVLYAGAAPSTVAGLFQLNVQIPYGVKPGNAVPLKVNAGLTDSQTGVTLAVSAATPDILNSLGMTFEPNVTDSLVLQGTDALGTSFSMFADRTPDGSPPPITSMMVTRGSQTTNVEFDSQQRPHLLRAANGATFVLDWSSATHAAVTATSSDGTVSVNTEFDLPAPAAKQELQRIAPTAKPRDSAPPTANATVTVNRCKRPTDDAEVFITVTPAAGQSAEPGAHVALPSLVMFQGHTTLSPGVYDVPIPIPDPDAGSKAITECDSWLNNQNVNNFCSGTGISNLHQFDQMCAVVASPLLTPPFTPAGASVLTACAASDTAVTAACAINAGLTAPVSDAGTITVGQKFCDAVGTYVDRGLKETAGTTYTFTPTAEYGPYTGSAPAQTATGAGPFPSFTIDIDDHCPDHITITPVSGEVNVGETLQFKATAFDADNTPLVSLLNGPPTNFVWSSSDGGIGSVDGNTGLVTGVGAGKATIMVRETLSNISATPVPVEVNQAIEYIPTFPALPPLVSPTVTSSQSSCQFGTQPPAVGAPGAVGYANFPGVFLNGALSDIPGYEYDLAFTCTDCEKGVWAFEGSGTFTLPIVSQGVNVGMSTMDVIVAGGTITETVVEDKTFTASTNSLSTHDSQTSSYDIRTGVQTFSWTGTAMYSYSSVPGCGPNNSPAPTTGTDSYSFAATYTYPVTPTPANPKH